jgi:cyclophilin family peptidyl-prolyl cis-trans isomerase/HEAT repeat protein
MAAYALLVTACASTPPPAPAPVVGFERKMAWILQLEDQRILRLPPQPPSLEPPVQTGRRRPPVAVPQPTSLPDLTVLVRDAEARVRRRAALAIGRVRLKDGVPPLVATLADTDPEVRAMAAFALGLIGDMAAEPSLTPFLADASPLVRGRAAEALGLIDAKGAAAAIGKLVDEYVRSAPVASMQPDDETWPAAPEAEAFKLGLFALVRLGAYEPLASAVLEGDKPISSWWPVAYAFQRIEDKRAAPALLQLLRGQGRYTRAFAARGLGALKETSATSSLLPLLDPKERTALEPTVAAIRALAQLNATGAVDPLTRLAADASTHANVRLEAVAALGAIGSIDGLPVVQDLLIDPWPAMRAAALQAAAAIDQPTFIAVLSGMEPDQHWRVRATLASILAALPAEVAVQRLRSMLSDEDKRVIPSVLAGLVKVRAPDIREILFERLKDPDFAVRAAAARQVGQLKPQGGAEALREAYTTGLPDSAYAARAAALESLVEYGPAEAIEPLKSALTDSDWAIRVRAAELLGRFDASADLQQAIRPVPATPIVPYDDPRLIAPESSPRVFIETAHGSIEFELAVLDAPQTTRNFMALARKGFFNGLEAHRVIANFVVQDGDPRGDGEGGAGYTIRDELNCRPYLRGTVGMALTWRDTGSSQFFITHSPQPHLDARYTFFGRVVDGMDIVDRIRPGDVIQSIRVWDENGWE